MKLKVGVSLKQGEGGGLPGEVEVAVWGGGGRFLGVRSLGRLIGFGFVQRVWAGRVGREGGCIGSGECLEGWSWCEVGVGVLMLQSKSWEC